MKAYNLLALGSAFAAAAAAAATDPAASSVKETSCHDKTYVYNSLSGYGFVPSNARDKHGDTISLGSSISIESWDSKDNGASYQGVLYALPDRGWNTEGTLNFQPRIHKYAINFSPLAADNASSSDPAEPNLQLDYLDTILLTGPDGAPTSGLDPDFTGGLEYPGFPVLPASTYTGDGFGADGPGGHRVSIDPEALVLSSNDGGFWISDEYGPYVYKFDKSGKMIIAIAPPDALLPLRNGTVSFSAASPPRYDSDKVPVPEDPTQGRANNQGFEGLTITPDGQTLYALLQSSAMQEGGEKSKTRRHVRLLGYSLPPSGGSSRIHAAASTPSLTGEWVVPLPTFTNADGKDKVAAQSELHFAGGSQFFVLPRDSGAGRGQDDTKSLYRHVDVFDIAKATDIKGQYDAFNQSVAKDGDLTSKIEPATVCDWLDINVNSELGKFGLHNGGEQDEGLLNEKWEGLALVPVQGGNDRRGAADAKGKQYYLFATSDNDFITQDGFMNGGKLPYKDESGFDLNSQVLVFKVTLPHGAEPLAR